MKHLLYRLRFWIVFCILFFIFNVCLKIFILEVDWRGSGFFISFLIDLLLFFNLFLFGFLIVYKGKFAKRKKFLVFAVGFSSFLYLVRAFQLVDYKYWNVVVDWINSVGILLTPISFLLLLIGMERFVRK